MMTLEEVMSQKSDEELFSIIEKEYVDYTAEALNIAYREIERRSIEIPIWYYKNSEGQQEGPFKRTDIFQLIKSGDISVNTLVWRRGINFWVAAGKETLLSNLFLEAVSSPFESEQTNDTQPPPFMASEDDIRMELQKYKQFREVKCLECGYSGLMGVVKEKKAWYMFWPIKIILAIICLSIFKLKGIIGVLAIVAVFTAIEEGTKKTYIHCPNCKRTLGPI